MKGRSTWSHPCALISAASLSLLACLWSGMASADAAESAKGLWMTAEKDAVLEFKECPEADHKGFLCGHIVWDKDAGTATDTCGMRIVELKRFEKEAWRDGWAYDPRDKKNYKATVRVKDGYLNIRAFIGVEILGETELLTRVDSMPTTPVCKK